MNRLQRRQLFISFFTISILFSSPTIFSADTIRLKKDVMPTFESVNLKLDPSEPGYSGNVSFELTVKNKTNTFIFHAEDMTIDELVLTGPDGPITTSQELGEKGRMTLTAEEELAPGEYRMGISFHANYNTQAVGLYQTESGGDNYLFTQFEESDARKAFPCFDEPAFKIPFQLTITAPEGQMVVSNTPIELETSNKGWTTTTFRKTKPLPSYLVAIAAGPLETVDVPNMPIPTRVVCVKGKSDLTGLTLEMTPPILKALTDYFDRPYPYEKLDLIAVPEFWAGAMENAGAITFRETVLLINPKSISVGQRSRLAEVMAHEMAHMWFGDLVTMEWWDDLWLNESFAEWMGNKISDQVYPKLGIGVSAIESSLRAMVSDARPTAIAIRPPATETADLLGNIGAVYSKGLGVLTMMELWLGKDTFRKGIQSYLSENEWSNATADNLWSALAEVSGKDVEKTLGSFITQPGVPLVTIDVTGQNKLTISQKRFMNYGSEAPEELTWHIPITLKYRDDTGVKQYSFVLSDKEETVSLAAEGAVKWLFPNVNSAGYYRWQIPTQMLGMLCNNSQDYLDVQERIGLIRNIGALLDAGIIDGGTYLKTLGLFSNDQSPIIVDNLISGLGKVESAFVPDSMKNEFAGYVRQMLKPALDHFGLEARENESEEISLVRPSIIGWLADEGQDKVVRKYLSDLGKKYFDDPTSIDPSLASVSLRTYAEDGDSSLFKKFEERVENSQVPAERSRYLYALGSFKKPELVDKALKFALSDKVYPQELFSIPYSVSSYSEANQMVVFNWVLDNYDEIAAKVPEPTKARLIFVARGCSREKLAEAKEFFTKEDRLTEDTHRMLARISAQVEDCAGLRDREGKAVASYLEQFESNNE